MITIRRETDRTFMKPATRVLAISGVILCFLCAASARKKQTPVANINFLVLRDENGKPIRNAAVVMHPVNDDGKQQRGGTELKTDPEGKTSYDAVPYGKLRIQVLAPGFQTFGNDYAIATPTLDTTIQC